ncbi:glycosyltransferase [Rhodonellum sp.]|uniref:glycosyltransferase n=1 Tax=Rhodonellum sp. TaxID=2231180 RepID=UPI0027191A2D|nr:glycosyltransferase [Rhodonellum sp.]MDO9551557.1 glycosyltransferase [Rhodonellum sp.]
MKKKILFTASIAKHIIRFHLPYLQWFKNQGFETHVACSGEEEIPFTDFKHNVPFIRNPFSYGHARAYKCLETLIDENDYFLIHCHTPMTSVLTRLAARTARLKGTKILYTAHGFHFFKGGPIHYWFTYFPIELFLSKYTDAIITINEEDYQIIKREESVQTKVFKIPGVGVSQKRFFPVHSDIKTQIRTKNNFSDQDFILVYAAEFIPRKNHVFIIKSAGKLIESLPNVKILFAGRGILKAGMEKLVSELGLNETIIFLGFREDIDEVFKMSDIGISASRQEGLGLNLVEEMMCGLPIVATQDKGHLEVIDHGLNGFLFSQNDSSGFINHILDLYLNEEMKSNMSKEAILKSKKFELSNSLYEMEKIYSLYLKQDQVKDELS